MKLLRNIFITFILFSCSRHQKPVVKTVDRAFYYWKSVFKLTSFEKAKVDSLQIKTLYLKFFDVEWNNITNKANPVAQITISDTGYLKRFNIVPVVFITNECLLKIDSASAISTAGKIYKLINDIAVLNNLKNINEIQLDCDWSVSTRQKYFSLLTRIKQLADNILVSATIRLHQVKYLKKSGVPPVQKGLLMCYNMGNLKNPSTINSIIETRELKKYVGNLTEYPISLDVALPLFEWKVLFRDGKFKGLIQNLPVSLLRSSSIVHKSNLYKFPGDTILAGYSFKKNDQLRLERSEYNTIISSVNEIRNKMLLHDLRVSLFHLDSITLSKYTINEMENMYNGFR